MFLSLPYSAWSSLLWGDLMRIVENGFLYRFLDLIGVSVTNPDYIAILSIVVSVILVSLLALFLGFLFKFLCWVRR